MDNSTVALLLAGGVVVLTLLEWIYGLLVRTPTLIHNAVWAVALTVTGSGLLHYNALSGQAWLLIAGGILAFNVGALLPALVRRNLPERTFSIAPLVTRKELHWLLGAYAVGVTYYLYALTGRYGLGTLLSNPASIRALTAGETYLEAVPVPIKVLYYLGPLLVVLVLNPWTVADPPRINTRIAMFVFLVVSQAALLQRTNLFIAFFWQIGLLVIEPPSISAWRQRWRQRQGHPSRRERVRRVRLILACGVLALGSFQFIASKLGTTEQPAEVTRNVDPRLQDSQWTSLLVYLSSGIPAFGNLVESDNDEAPPSTRTGNLLVGDYNPQTWGRATFTAALDLVPVAEPWEPIAPFTRVPFLTNVYTWFEPFYRDFRAAGVIGMSFLTGLLLASAQRRRVQGSGWLLVAALAIGLTAWAPFVNAYGSLLVIESLGIAWWLGHRRRSSPRGQEPLARSLARQ